MDGSTTLTNGTDYNVSYSNNIYAGTATVRITGTGNYSGTITKTFTISRRSVTIKADSQTISYGSSIGYGTWYITTSGLASGDRVTSISLSQSTSNVTSSGYITPSNATIKSGSINVTSSYNIYYQSGNLVITVSRSATAGSCNSLTYNGSSQLLASGGSNVTYSNNYGTSSGSHSVTVTTNSNYAFSDGSTSKTLWCSISSRSLTIKADNQTINYGSSIKTGTSYVSVSGLASGDSLTSISLSQSTTSVTTSGTITPSGASISSGSSNTTSNYSISYQTGTLVIVDTSPPSVSISISGESYSSGYKSGAVATVSCSASGGISSFSASDNTGDSGSFSTNTDTYKVKTIKLVSASSSRTVSVSCTSNSGKLASTSRTYAIYEYSRDSACSCAERNSCKSCTNCGSSTTYGSWSGYTCENPKPSSTSTKAWSCQKDPKAEFCVSSKYYKCRSRSITTTCKSCKNSSCSCKTRNKCWHT